jgi:hypothetical protein
VKLDPTDLSVVSSFLAPCSRPESLAWDGKYLWCASFDEGMIYQIDIGLSAPSAPQNLQTTSNDDYVKLSWDVPGNDGGSPLIGYSIYRDTTYGGENSPLTTIGNVLTYIDYNVINDQTYYYQVSAENSAGEGEKSNQGNTKPTKKPINWVNIAALIAAIVTIVATVISYFNSRKSVPKEKN